MVPNNIKNCSLLNKFKNSVDSWKLNERPCRLCKKYIVQVGFIWFTSPFCNISEEKNICYTCYISICNIYIYFVCFEIFYKHFVFVHCAEWGSFAWAKFLGDSSKGLRRRCISWGFPRWGIGWKKKCILSSGCHYLSAYLFIYYYYFFGWR